MAQFITKKSSTRHIRIIRLEPTYNPLRQLKHFFQRLCFSDPICVPADAAIETLFEAIQRKGLYPFQDSICRIADSLKAVRCQVYVDTLQLSNGKERTSYLTAYISGNLMFRAKFTLKTQNNIAILTTFLKVYQPHHPFWQRYKLVLV